MPRDRFSEFQERAQIAKADELNGEVVVYTKSNGDGLHSFLTEIDLIRQQLNDLTKDFDRLSVLQKDVIAIPDETRKKEIDNLLAQVDNTFEVLGRRITKLRVETERLEKSGENIDGAVFRIRQQQISAVLKTYTVEMQRYRENQIAYKQILKTTLQKEFAIVGKNTDESELDNMIEQGTVSAFTQNYIAQTDQARQTLNLIEERHKNLLKIQRSLEHLQQLFSEIYLTIKSDGEMLDNIERNVSNVKDVMINVNENLKQAKTYRRKARRLKIILCSAIVIVLIIVIIIIIVTVVPNNDN